MIIVALECGFMICKCGALVPKERWSCQVCGRSNSSYEPPKQSLSRRLRGDFNGSKFERKSRLGNLFFALAVVTGVLYTVWWIDPLGVNPSSSLNATGVATNAGDTWTWRLATYTEDVCRWSDLKPEIDSWSAGKYYINSSWGRAKKLWYNHLIPATEARIKDPENYWQIENCNQKLVFKQVEPWPERYDIEKRFLPQSPYEVTGKSFVVDHTDLAYLWEGECVPPLGFGEEIELQDRYGGVIGLTKFVSCDYFIVGSDIFPRSYNNSDYKQLFVITTYNYATEIFNDIDGIISLLASQVRDDEDEILEWVFKPDELVNGILLYTSYGNKYEERRYEFLNNNLP